MYSDTEGNGTIYRKQQYLDSDALHFWLNKLKGSFYSIPEHTQVLPIFLFDFGEMDMMLIDQKLPVKSFPEMVIAVQTKDPYIRIPFQCNDKPLTLDGLDVPRRVTGAVLQSLLGVLPTGEFWSESHQRLEEDWMWNVANTPFGVFNNAKEWSFSQYDGGYRPHLYQLINQTITHTLEPLIHLLSYHYEIHHLVNEEDFIEFVVRWNLFQYKLRECMEQMSLHQWREAYRFVRSAYHDSERLLKIILHARQQISFFLQCEHVRVLPRLTCVSSSHCPDPQAPRLALSCRILDHPSCVRVDGAGSDQSLWPAKEEANSFSFKEIRLIDSLPKSIERDCVHLEGVFEWNETSLCTTRGAWSVRGGSFTPFWQQVFQRG